MWLDKTRGRRWLKVLGGVFVFQLLFLPFTHFHPDHTHRRPGGLGPEHHSAHFHSPEIEGVGRLLGWMIPSGIPGKHQHETDSSENPVWTTTVSPKTPKGFLPQGLVPVGGEVPATHLVEFSIAHPLNPLSAQPVDLPQKRGPPILFC